MMRICVKGDTLISIANNRTQLKKFYLLKIFKFGSKIQIHCVILQTVLTTDILKYEK